MVSLAYTERSGHPCALFVGPVEAVFEGGVSGNEPFHRRSIFWGSPRLILALITSESELVSNLHAPCDSPSTSRFASRLVLAMSAWSVKTRRAPSRHRRDARVYGHTTTVVHDNEYAPPPSPPQKEPLSGWLKRPTDGTTDRTQVDDSCKCPAARVRSSRQPY